MAFFHDKINEIKQKGPVDILNFKFNQKLVSIRMADDSDETINLLTKWRRENWNWFDSKFNVTFDGTKNWLEERIFKNPDRILFLIIYDGIKIGQYGMSEYNEKNNFVWLGDLIKGEPNTAPGIMQYVDKIFIKWVFDTFKINTIRGKVFSDNFRTFNLHDKAGWVMINNIPLKRKYTDDGWIWEKMELKSEEEYGERYFNIIEITKKRLMEKFGELEFQYLI